MLYNKFLSCFSLASVGIANYSNTVHLKDAYSFFNCLNLVVLFLTIFFFY